VVALFGRRLDEHGGHLQGALDMEAARFFEISAGQAQIGM
jgi:hypothetical protein